MCKICTRTPSTKLTLGIRLLRGGLGSRANLEELDKPPWFEGKNYERNLSVFISLLRGEDIFSKMVFFEEVSDSPCLLRCRLQGLVRDKECGHLRTAKSRTFQIARLPVPKDKKERLAASAAIRLAKHEWFQKLRAQADFRIVEGAVNQLCGSPGLHHPRVGNFSETTSSTCSPGFCKTR